MVMQVLHLLGRQFGFFAIASFTFLCLPNLLNAQTEELRQLPTSMVEIKEQAGRPVSIEMECIEAPLDDHYIRINFKIRNLSQKPIVGIVTVVGGQVPGISDTTFRAANPLTVSELQDEELRIEYPDGNIYTKKIALSVAHVRFDNGTSWSEDPSKKYPLIDDAVDGSRFAVTDLLTNFPNPSPGSVPQMKEFSKARLDALNLPDNDEFKGQTAAYKGGYRNVFNVLCRPEYSKPDAFLKKVDELRMRLIDLQPAKP